MPSTSCLTIRPRLRGLLGRPSQRRKAASTPGPSGGIPCSGFKICRAQVPIGEDSGLGFDERPDGGGAPFHHGPNLILHGIVHPRELAAKDEPGGVIVDRLEQHPSVDGHRSVTGLDSYHLLRFELDDLHGAFGGLAESSGASLDDRAHTDGLVRGGFEFERRVPPRMILDMMNCVEVPYRRNGSINGRGNLELQDCSLQMLPGTLRSQLQGKGQLSLNGG